MWPVGIVGDHPCPSRYFESVFNASGLQALVAQYGDWFSYTKNPRAKIFQRDQSMVEDMDSMVRLMRWVSTLQAWHREPPLHGSSIEPATKQLGPQMAACSLSSLGCPFLLGGGDGCPGPRPQAGAEVCLGILSPADAVKEQTGV